MDIEFHYYITYLIAARAGFTPAQAVIVAHSAQGVDDNHIPVRMTDSAGNTYANDLSQTMDILRPHEDKLIYPIFHFIPGDPNAPGAARADGRTDRWVTTPDNALANRMIDAALASGDLYRIGVSAHGFVDTWAHQNFLGRRDSFNEFGQGFVHEVLDFAMAVGHAHAGHQPDWPALIWQDTRLATPTVDNKARFLAAAHRLYEKFVQHLQPALADATIQQSANELVADLDADIGAADPTNAAQRERIRRYIQRGKSNAYGGAAIPPYITGLWFSQAIAEDHDKVERDARGASDTKLASVEAFIADVFADAHRQTVTWRHPHAAVYQTTHWYQFQEAVKAHRKECAAMLEADGIFVDA